MKPCRADLEGRDGSQDQREHRRAGEVTPPERHGEGVTSGLAQRRREDFQDPESERDLGDLGRVGGGADHQGFFRPSTIVEML